jgi:hypothetical protein
MTVFFVVCLEVLTVRSGKENLQQFYNIVLIFCFKVMCQPEILMYRLSFCGPKFFYDSQWKAVKVMESAVFAC